MNLSLVSTSQKTSSSGSNKTNLLTWNTSSGNSRWFTNVLVITTSVWMVNWVHSDSSHDWEVLSLGLMSPVLNTSLKNWLFISSTGTDNTNHGSRLTVNSLSDTRRKFDSGLKAIFRMSNDSNKRTRSSGEFTIVSFSELDIANESSLRDLSDWENVTNLKGSIFSTEDGLS